MFKYISNIIEYQDDKHFAFIKFRLIITQILILCGVKFVF